jgi:hypothetical protein
MTGTGPEGLPDQDRIHVALPQEPPALTPGTARALLRLLLAEAGGGRIQQAGPPANPPEVPQ